MALIASCSRSDPQVPHHLSSITHPTPETLDAAISAALSADRVDIVFLAGYLKRLGPATLAAFHGRVLNTYPALLPKFGGQGMFGDHVFEAVLPSGVSESGVSVHFVDDNYDTGRIVRQVRVAIETKDCVESLKARVREREREVVVETLAAIATGELRLAAAG
jgi:phosphoribosylglycinamide formyltransferase 1